MLSERTAKSAKGELRVAEVVGDWHYLVRFSAQGGLAPANDRRALLSSFASSRLSSWPPSAVAFHHSTFIHARLTVVQRRRL